MFSFIKNHLQKIYTSVTGKLQSIFARSSIDEQTFAELEALLLQADTGAKATRALLASVRKKFERGELATGVDLQEALKHELVALLRTARQAPENPQIFLMVGINGSGKTTFTSKLAAGFTQQGKKVLLVAADTFRAAAVEQLATWSARTNTALVMGKPGQDPSSVIFTACQEFKKNQYDVMIIDTAGRLQAKTHLMKELEKIKKTVTGQLPGAQVCTLLTVDSMLGQNSFEQAKLFHESTHLDGIVLTKMDGTGKGGIVFAITQELAIPVLYISYGERLEDYTAFDAEKYVDDLLAR